METTPQTLRYNDRLLSVAWSPDSRRLASTSYRRVVVWDVAEAEILWVLDSRGSFIKSMMWSPDGTMLASTGEKVVLVWNALTGEALHTLTAPTIFWDDLAWSPDGRILAGSAQGTITLWDVATWEILRTLNGFGMIWSPHSRTLAYSANPPAITFCDPATGQVLRSLTDHSGEWGFCWSPDSELLASVRGSYQIILSDAATGQVRRSFGKNTDSLTRIAWSPKGQWLASGGCGRRTFEDCRSGAIKVWDRATGTNVRTFSGHTDSVAALGWSPDGQTLASAGGEDILLWDVSDLSSTP